MGRAGAVSFMPPTGAEGAAAAGSEEVVSSTLSSMVDARGETRAVVLPTLLLARDVDWCVLKAVAEPQAPRARAAESIEVENFMAAA